MRHYIAYVLLLFVLAACGKDNDSTPGNQFIINGVHDVSMDSTGGNIMPVGVALTSGVQEQVTLSVTGLPLGITADIKPANGTPAFGSVITFNRAGTVTGGTYPLKLVGTSASYTKSYDFSLVVSKNVFEMIGIDDVATDALNNMLTVTVQHKAGVAEPVTLSVSGLPAGVAADIRPVSGTPDFISSITFNQTSATVAAGNYPIKITGTSATYTKSYDLKLTVAAFNGFTANGEIFIAYGVTRFTGSGYSSLSVNTPQTASGITNLSATIAGNWPATDGIYTYPVGPAPSSTTIAVTHNIFSGNFRSTANGATATVTISGGKVAIKASGIVTTSANGGSGGANLNVDIHEP